jgi:phosphodiesterase/alkaline phosphatase D-like protein
MPVPLSSKPGRDETRVYRRIRYGDIADFNILDMRQYRTDNPAVTASSRRATPASTRVRL